MNKVHGPLNRALRIFPALMVLTASIDASARTRNVNVTRGGGGSTRSAAMTGSQGNTVTREVQRNRDPETGTVNRNSTVTGTEGQTIERSSTATRTEDGVSRSGTVTGPDGNTVNREAQGSRDPATQTWTKSVTVTGNEKEEETE